MAHSPRVDLTVHFVRHGRTEMNLLRLLQGQSGYGLLPEGIDDAERTVRRAGGPDVELSAREAALLGVLAARPRQVFSRRDLLERVFDSAGSDNAVDTYVHYCRRKLGRDVISTVRGLGYRLGTA